MNRLKYLDGLRGLAALMVVFHHFLLDFYPATFTGNGSQSNCTGYPYDALIGHSFLNIFISGNLAVCIFFVLSGLVLSRHFLITKNPVILSEQAVRRYFRLGIPIFASLVIAFLLVQFDCFYNKPVSAINHSPFLTGSLWSYKYSIPDFLYLCFIDVFMTGQNDLNGVLWTMHIEFFGSFLVFAVLALTQYLNKRFLIYLLVITVQCCLHNYYYICFLAGVMIADAEANETKWLTAWSQAISWIVFFFALFLGSVPSSEEAQSISAVYRPMILPMPQYTIFYHSISAILLISAIRQIEVIKVFLESRWLQYLGRISFAMYLIHSLIIGSATLFIFLKIEPLMAYWPDVFISLLATIATTLFFSHFFTVYIDEKSTVISKIIYRRFFKNAKYAD